MNPQKAYSSAAKFYDFGPRLSAYKRAVDHFIEQIPLKVDSSIKVLDAGCGTGLYSFAILKRFPNAQIVAFDLNKKLA